MNTNCKCTDLMLQMQQIGFMLVDLNLYLDMHPDCEMAQKDFEHLRERMCHLRTAYEKQQGPLLNFGLSDSAFPWQWVDESMPWPWENKKCNC